jgi:hypothetical protein
VDNGDNMDFYNFQILLEKIKDLIGNYNYTGALSFKEYLDHPKKDEIIGALEYSNYRLNFDFDNANKIAKKNSIIGRLNERLEKINDEKSNTIEKLEHLILELLDNMEIELKNGNYANFLARVYRLEEAMGQYFVLKWYDNNKLQIEYEYWDKYKKKYETIRATDIDENEINWKLKMNFINLSNDMKEEMRTKGISLRGDFTELLNEIKRKKLFNDKYAKLKKFINYYYINKDSNNKIKLKGRLYNIKDINTNYYYKLIKCLYGENSKEYGIYSNIQKIYKKKSRNLRNSTIVAHGFKGASIYDIGEGISKNCGSNQSFNDEKTKEICKEEVMEFFKNIKKEFYSIVYENIENRGVQNKNNGNNNNIFDKINDTIISNLKS